MTWQAGPHPDDVPRRVAPADEPRAFRPQQLRHEPVVIRPRADTREIVVVELLPLAAPILAYAATQVFLPWGVPLMLAAIVVAALAALVFAARDAAMLRLRGFIELPSAALALVSPILYIALRGRAVSGHDKDGFAPLPWAIGSTVVAIGLMIALNAFMGAVDAGLGGLGDIGGLLGGLPG